jgi:hypothetical protein
LTESLLEVRDRSFIFLPVPALGRIPLVPTVVRRDRLVTLAGYRRRQQRSFVRSCQFRKMDISIRTRGVVRLSVGSSFPVLQYLFFAFSVRPLDYDRPVVVLMASVRIAIPMDAVRILQCSKLNDRLPQLRSSKVECGDAVLRCIGL